MKDIKNGINKRVYSLGNKIRMAKSIKNTSISLVSAPCMATRTIYKQYNIDWVILTKNNGSFVMLQIKMKIVMVNITENIISQTGLSPYTFKICKC